MLTKANKMCYNIHKANTAEKKYVCVHDNRFYKQTENWILLEEEEEKKAFYSLDLQ